MKMRCALVFTPTRLVTPPPPQAHADALGSNAQLHATATAPILPTRFISTSTQESKSAEFATNGSPEPGAVLELRAALARPAPACPKNKSTSPVTRTPRASVRVLSRTLLSLAWRRPNGRTEWFSSREFCADRDVLGFVRVDTGCRLRRWRRAPRLDQRRFQAWSAGVDQWRARPPGPIPGHRRHQR